MRLVCESWCFSSGELLEFSDRDCDCDLRATGTWPRVRSEVGGPREVSMPWPLWKAGGLRFPGERASLVDEGWAAKYEGEFEDELDV
jgi:hypothetical protein